MRKRVTWLHPAYLLLLLTGVFLYAIAASVASKTAEIEIGVCAKHRRWRLQAIVGGWTLVVLGAVALPWLAMSFEALWLAVVGVGMILVGSIGGFLVARQVAAARIEDDRVWLVGVNRDYLGELPPGPPRG